MRQTLAGRRPPGLHHRWTGVGRLGRDAARRKGFDRSSATDFPGKKLQGRRTTLSEENMGIERSDRNKGQHEKVGQGEGILFTWCLQVNWTAICGDHLEVLMFGRPAEVNFVRTDFRSHRQCPALWT